VNKKRPGEEAVATKAEHPPTHKHIIMSARTIFIILIPLHSFQ